MRMIYVGTNSTESELIKNSLKNKFNLLSLDLNKVVISFDYYRDLSIFYKYETGFDFLESDAFMSRSANNDFVCLIAEVLNIIYNSNKNGCDIIDGMERFKISSKSPKLSSILYYHGVGSYPKTVVVYNSEIFKEYLKFRYGDGELTKKWVYKPVSGSHGEGMRLISSWKDIGRNDGLIDNVKIYQEFIELESEYRVYLYNGQILCCMNKTIEQENSKKLFSGRRLTVSEVSNELSRFILSYNWRPGFIGADIGLSKNGKFFVFEQNRAPDFEQTNSRLKEVGLPTLEILLAEAIYEELSQK